jgi:acetyl esterase/lipase
MFQPAAFQRQRFALFCMVFCLYFFAEKVPAQEPTPNAIKPTGLQLQNYDSVVRTEAVYLRLGDRELKMDLFSPRDSDHDLPCVVVVHGGGWLKGGRSKFYPLAEALAARGYVAVAIEYRLGGEAKFPAAVQDCFAAVKYLRTNAKNHRINPEKIAAVGGSAGGHLVGLLATAPDHPAFQHESHAHASAAIQTAVVMAGPMDLATGPVAERSRKDPDHSNSNQWLGKTIDEDLPLYQLASPISHITASCPPMLFMTGEYDAPERNVATRDRLRELGISTEILVYQQGKHGCWNQHPWFDSMVEDLHQFLCKSLDIQPQFQLPLKSFDWGAMSREGNSLKLSIKSMNLLKSGVSIPLFHSPIGTISVAGKPDLVVECTPQIDRWDFKLKNGEAATDEPVVLTVELLGRPALESIAPIQIANNAGTVELFAHLSTPVGKLLRYEPQPHKNTVGYWVNPEDHVHWQFYLDHPGEFQLRLFQGCGKGQGGSEINIRIDDQVVKHTAVDTGHFQNFQWFEPGAVTLAAGLHTLTIVPEKIAKQAAMDVRKVELVPIK